MRSMHGPSVRNLLYFTEFENSPFFFFCFCPLSFRRNERFIVQSNPVCVCQSVRSASSFYNSEDNKLIFVKSDTNLMHMELIPAPGLTVLF